MEVYKLHFEHGVPTTRIAELMKVDRNTIINDLKILYQEALNDYDPNNMSLDDILQKQLLRLETQGDRLATSGSMIRKILQTRAGYLNWL
jgi:Mn-dependent DtxR family transcriptional regulator